MQCVEDSSQLINNGSSSLCQGMSPGNYGARENCRLTVDWDSLLHCAVQAYDSEGNRAQLSNIVEVITPSEPTTPAPPVEEVVDTHTKELLEIIRLGN